MPTLPFLRRRDPEPSANNTPAEAKGGAGTFAATLRDLLVVTYAVPPARVAPHLPPGLVLDRLPGPEGEPIAFVQVLCAFHEDARWSPLPGGVGQDFHQVTYRVLARKAAKEKENKDSKSISVPGVWVLRTFVSASELHLTQRAVGREADFARFSLYIDGDPARGTYRSYSVRAVGDTGITDLKVRILPDAPPPPIPFGKTEDMVAFLTGREENYYRASVPKDAVGLLPTRQGPLSPVWGELTSARLTALTDPKARQGLDILTAAELTNPLAVFVQPALTLYSYPPRLAKLAVPSADTPATEPLPPDE